MSLHVFTESYMELLHHPASMKVWDHCWTTGTGLFFYILIWVIQLFYANSTGLFSASLSILTIDRVNNISQWHEGENISGSYKAHESLSGWAKPQRWEDGDRISESATTLLCNEELDGSLGRCSRRALRGEGAEAGPGLHLSSCSGTPVCYPIASGGRIGKRMI